MTKTLITKHSFDLEEKTLVWLLIVGIWNLFDVWNVVIGV